MSSSAKQLRNDFIRVALTLFAIAAIVALLLAVANFFTAPVIARSAEDRLNQSLKVLFENASSFEEAVCESSVTVNGVKVPVKAAYTAKDSSGGTLGYCVEVAPSGYSNQIDMIVAVSAEGAVSGTRILSMQDTPGIGMRVMSDEAFQERVIGLEDPAKIVKSAPAGKSEVQVISGASISSSAYINGVSAALITAEKIGQGGV